MLKDERKAISRLIKDSNLVVLDEFPADMVFGPNEFVKLDGGIYLNVVDTGNGRRAVENKTEVYVRFIVKGLIGSDTAAIDLIQNSARPLSFTYPLNADNGYNFASTSMEYYYLSEGTSVPLQYVGEGGIVKLIVPFKKGSESDQGNGVPRYYMLLKYTKFNN